MENELRELAEQLGALATRLPRGSAVAGAIERGIAATRGRDDAGKPVPWSLGPCLKLLRALADRDSAPKLDIKGLSSVTQLGRNLKWVEDTKKLRDSASHCQYEADKPAMRKALREFFVGKGTGVAGVVEARGAVRRASVEQMARSTI